MKKTLIALALVSLPVAASAEVILYGKIRGGVEFTREGTSAQLKSERNAWGVVDYGSYIGFKGSEDLGGNLKAIWQVESNASLNGGSFVNNRDSFIGLEGGFGTVKVGRVVTPLKASLDDQDNWEYNSETLGLSRYTRFGQRRTSLNYQSPDFSGFDFSFQMAPGTNVHGDRTNDGKPVFGLGLGYKNSGFFVRYAAEYARKSTTGTDGLKDSHVHNLSAGYDANNLYVAGAFQYGKNVNPIFTNDAADAYDIAHDTVNGGKTKEAQISAAYTFGSITPKISVAYGRGDSNDVQTDGARYLQAIVGADYAFSRRTTGLVSVGWLRDKANSNADNVNSWGVGTGLVHKF
ncbi:porin [Eikenella sp. S3360]|uniref:Porin n=1 Tax=Eikenella glucosivorans TaxID=2766967 RepID=A0ABS0N9T0_9NEIS|nr:porin [Eikenella glucosivorans]MBH5329035.1 porin [Eikenella glucosivorans]